MKILTFSHPTHTSSRQILRVHRQRCCAKRNSARSTVRYRVDPIRISRLRSWRHLIEMPGRNIFQVVPDLSTCIGKPRSLNCSSISAFAAKDTAAFARSLTSKCIF
jgi:hypothetical protein